ncbi:unnamed protein product [Didymodactylos carnosus]|uniref:Uncharacterized protein n=1 Tax=Didymodactylos carnosus TaxID=1234261 RepID=A0A815AKP3_9BILA|nr:unnamed protein product [Didymodactylos carnosus]CAF1259166.1 unnamed protein product [Didymodactylos carnosus]CAF3707057.1 unnamed protein product [Didymodactylos carnosus]CAF4035126.1 unnamed protein product [Didymodactylos carnosus]
MPAMCVRVEAHDGLIFNTTQGQPCERLLRYDHSLPMYNFFAKLHSYLTSTYGAQWENIGIIQFTNPETIQFDVIGFGMVDTHPPMENAQSPTKISRFGSLVTSSLSSSLIIPPQLPNAKIKFNAIFIAEVTTHKNVEFDENVILDGEKQSSPMRILLKKFIQLERQLATVKMYYDLKSNKNLICGLSLFQRGVKKRKAYETINRILSHPEFIKCIPIIIERH